MITAAARFDIEFRRRLNAGAKYVDVAMPAPRFFVKEPLVARSAVTLTGETARYIGRVLRCRPGDPLSLFDGTGMEFAATIDTIGKHEVRVAVAEHCARSVESPLFVRLAQVVSRGDRMDFVVQKATELGVRRITPLQSEFSVVKLGADRATRRQLHWQRISESACEQCGRNVPPRIDAPMQLQDYLTADCDNDTLRIIATPGESQDLASLEQPAQGVELLIGPEGGFSREEQRRAEQCRFQPIGMGPRVLRTETAAIVAVTMVQALWGDLADGRGAQR